ncbi:MAG: LegC family aminotransferase [Gammaproteobacteria bacterium]|nr:LegC family aminotransferase [Gammaproteobacteria bacterium]
MFDCFVRFVRDAYQTNDFIPLHEPLFNGREKEYMLDTIDSTFVSSVGAYVSRFEEDVASYTGAKYAVATVNGTAALHAALLLAGVERGDEVITQSLTFVATCNAIAYCGGEPVFVDVDRNHLGLSAEHLQAYLDEHAEVREGQAWNRTTSRRIAACVPMHTFGHSVDMDSIISICEKYTIPVVEDAAESLGSKWRNHHTGTLGNIGVLSFNGNKIITTGGGGMILTNCEETAKRAKHLTTTAKVTHKWEFVHDEIGYNYRMPNINAALGVAQMEELPRFVAAKRVLAQHYKSWCEKHEVKMLHEPDNAYSNYWLNTLFLEDSDQRDAFLEYTNNNAVMTRPAWQAMHCLSMYAKCHHGSLENTEWAMGCIVNIPSSVAKLAIV